MARTPFLFSFSKKVTLRWFSEICTMNTYSDFMEVIGSKNHMFTNRKISYYFRKKIIDSNKR